MLSQYWINLQYYSVQKTISHFGCTNIIFAHSTLLCLQNFEKLENFYTWENNDLKLLKKFVYEILVYSLLEKIEVTLYPPFSFLMQMNLKQWRGRGMEIIVQCSYSPSPLELYYLNDDHDSGDISSPQIHLKGNLPKYWLFRNRRRDIAKGFDFVWMMN